MARPWYQRTLLSTRWLHNWIGVFIGVLLVLWIVSGLIMLLPVSETARAGQGTGRTPDWSALVVSPSQAALAAQAAAGGSRATSVGLQRLRDGMAYVVRLEEGRRILVDAATAQVVEVTESLAVAIAGDVLRGKTVARVERIERPSGGYAGPLPAWHVVFSDAAATEAWVNAVTGEVRRTERRDRLKNTWGHDAHVFTPLRDGPGGERFRKLGLWATSLVLLTTTLFGYWLALPRRWRSPRAVPEADA